MNFFPAKLRKEGATIYVNGDKFSIPVPAERAGVYQDYDGKRGIFGIRPENIHRPDFVPPNIHAELVSAKGDDGVIG